MKLASWNVNGIRACSRGGFLDWFESLRADVVAVQEIKCFPEQLEPASVNPLKYHSVWNPAKKPGYSGVAVFSRKEPLDVKLGLGVPEFDSEGRVIQADFGDFTLINAYFPNSQRDHARLPYKLAFCKEMKKLTDRLKRQGKNVIVCGDWNIAHREIDLRNPKANEKNAGFLPEEREWIDSYLKSGYVDAFRHANGDEREQYTWWSYRPGVREKNVGWRLDYHVVNAEYADRVKRATHQPDVRGSDHCPVVLELRK